MNSCSQYRFQWILLIGLFVTVFCKGQCTDTTKICKLNYDLIKTKTFGDVLNEKYKIKFKRAQKVDISLNDNDTISFYIKSKKNRKSTITLEKLFFDQQEYFTDTTYAFIAKRPGKYIVYIKNRSFRNTEFYLSVKKVIRDTSKKKDTTPAAIVYAKLDLIVDTLRTEVDTTIYLPCQLNLKLLPKETLTFKSDTHSIIKSFVHQRGDFPTTLRCNNQKIKLPLNPECKTTLDKKQGIFEFELEIFSLNTLKAENIEIDSVLLASIKSKPTRSDSLKREIIQKDVQIEAFKRSVLSKLNKVAANSCSIPLSNGTYSLVLENNDRVVGKYYHVRMRETILTIKLKEEKK